MIAAALAAIAWGCATAPPPAPAPIADAAPEIAAANLAHTQLAALVYQDLLTSIAAGDLDSARADLCEWLRESTVFLLAAVDELPAEYHTRTVGVLERLREPPPGCSALEEIAPRIEQALARLGAG